MRSLIDLLQLAGQVAVGTGDNRDSDGGTVPDFTGIQLRDRQVEGVAEAILEGADDLAAILDRLRVWNLDLEGQAGDWNDTPPPAFLRKIFKRLILRKGYFAKYSIISTYRQNIHSIWLN